jgi:CMP-N,N'-diacetyllegionaminic acid synthase
VKFVIIIPARGGSTRVKNKNIRPLNGRPLLSHTLDCLKEADLLAHTYVSTNDDQIAQVALNESVQVINRPEEFSSATASTESALMHALVELEKKSITADWIMTLPPTSPFRSVNSINNVVKMAQTCEPEVDCIMSVTENRGDFWHLKDGNFQRLFPNAPRRQQDRDPLFEENSAIYMTRVKTLKHTGSILGTKVLPYYMNTIEAIDINDPLDLDIAETISRSMEKS